jgi:signal transduction histidine kinase
VGGSGLGLAIAQGLAVANGCTLALDPEVERGSRFLLTLPAPWRPSQ